MRLLLRRGQSTEALGLDEAECYRRCHGEREGEVRILPPEPVRPAATIATYWPRPVNPRITGEEIRRQFLAKLEARKQAGPD